MELSDPLQSHVAASSAKTTNLTSTILIHLPYTSITPDRNLYSHVGRQDRLLAHLRDPLRQDGLD